MKLKTNKKTNFFIGGLYNYTFPLYLKLILSFQCYLALSNQVFSINVERVIKEDTDTRALTVSGLKNS